MSDTLELGITWSLPLSLSDSDVESSDVAANGITSLAANILEEMNRFCDGSPLHQPDSGQS